jgi:quinol monooxygenase YgiN
MAYVVAAKWIARPGEEEEVARCVREMTAPSRSEPGNLLYQAHRDPANPRVFFLYEQYVDEAGYQAHVDSAHFQATGFGDAIPRLEAREREFYWTIDEG